MPPEAEGADVGGPAATAAPADRSGSARSSDSVALGRAAAAPATAPAEAEPAEIAGEITPLAAADEAAVTADDPAGARANGNRAATATAGEVVAGAAEAPGAATAAAATEARADPADRRDGEASSATATPRWIGRDGAAVAAGRGVVLEGATLEVEVPLGDEDRAAGPHPAPRAEGAVAAAGAEALDVEVSDRQLGEDSLRRRGRGDDDARRRDDERAEVEAADALEPRTVALEDDAAHDEGSGREPRRIEGIHDESAHLVDRARREDDRVRSGVAGRATGIDHRRGIRRVDGDVEVEVRREDRLLEGAVGVGVDLLLGGGDIDGRRDREAWDEEKRGGESDRTERPPGRTRSTRDTETEDATADTHPHGSPSGLTAVPLQI
ncbi:MAG: hypothetical protein H6511_05450 [Holophagales bacterium]|nr:hypothetical protein [Holophagales bacterium]